MAYYVLSYTFFAVNLEQFFLLGVGMLLFSFAFRYTCSAFLQKEKITEHLFVKFTADHLFTGCSICLMLLMSLHQIVPGKLQRKQGHPLRKHRPPHRIMSTGKHMTDLPKPSFGLCVREIYQ